MKSDSDALLRLKLERPIAGRSFVMLQSKVIIGLVKNYHGAFRMKAYAVMVQAAIQANETIAKAMIAATAIALPLLFDFSIGTWAVSSGSYSLIGCLLKSNY